MERLCFKESRDGILPPRAGGERSFPGSPKAAPIASVHQRARHALSLQLVLRRHPEFRHLSMDRRRFSKTMAMAAAAGLLDMKNLFASASAGSKLKIDRIEIFPVRYPMVMRFKFFEGPVSAGGRPAVIIKITASDGTVGWGESVPIPRWSGETLEGAVACLKNYLIPVLIGQDALDIANVHRLMTKEIAHGFSTSYPITKAGIDIALHDLLGKSLKKNLAEIWGKKTPDDLVLSWTLNPKEVGEIEGLMRKGRERGFENFNVKVA